MPDDTSPGSGQQTPTTMPAQQSQPQAPAGAPTTSQQVSSPKPAYSFDSIEAATAFAEAQLELKRKANAEAARSNNELATLKQQVEALAADAKAAKQRAIASDVQLAAKTAGFRKPEHVYSIIQAQLAYDANGQPTNVQAVLDALKASDSYLLETPAAPTGVPSQPAAPQAPAQPRTGVMNAPRSAVTAGTLTWEEAMRVVKNPAEYARRMKEVDAFLANPANRPQR